MTAYGVMNVTLETILHTDDWSDTTVESVRQALVNDPILARQVWSWVQLSDRAGCGLDAVMPPVDDLMTLAMDRSGRRLDADMRGRLEACQSEFVSACALHPSLNAIVDRMAEDISAFDHAWKRSVESTTARQPATMSAYFPRVAAAVVAIAAVLLVVFLVQQDSTRILTAEADGIRLVALEDGSRVRLVDGASLQVTEGSPRDVRLEGKAFFEVSADANSPFSVRSADVVTTVLGTSFGVEALPTETRVSVVTGQVRVEAGGQAAWLEEGMSTRVPLGGVPEIPLAFEDSATLDWTGLFIFRNTPIDSVAALLGRSFGVRIVVDTLLADRDLTGTFDQDQGLDEILGVVAAAVGADLEIGEPGQGVHYRLFAIRP